MNITIDALQAYLSDRYSGWATEQSMFMKLVEEIGEVAEVLNKRAGMVCTADLPKQMHPELEVRYFENEEVYTYAYSE